MFYWLYLQYSHYLQSLDPAHAGYVPVLNLLKYQTFRTGLAIFTSQLVVVVTLLGRAVQVLLRLRSLGAALDGKHLLDHTLTEAVSGKIGLWSKTDSVSYFDQYTVTK